MDNEKYLKIGDFAKLCNVTKDTLFHYERIGILKPEIKTEKGYRYYSVKQYFTFDIISILKEAGVSLKEIKWYLENIDTDVFIALLTEKYEAFEKEHKKIEHMKNVLKNTISIIRQTAGEKCSIPVTMECDEQYMMIISFEREEKEKERMEKIYRHYRFCLDKGLSETLTSGFITKKCNLGLISRHYYEADHFFCEISQKYDSDLFFTKPKGKYAIMYHQGPYDTIADTYEKLFDYIKSESLAIIGNAYEFELIGFLNSNDPDKYVVRVAIEVDQT